MRRLENWLYDNTWPCWVLRLVLIALFLTWATGIAGALISAYRAEMAFERNRDPAKDLQQMRELGKYADQKLANARKKGLDYGPADYFRDLREITAEAEKRHLPTVSFAVNQQTTEMQEFMRSHCKPNVIPMSPPDEVRKLVEDPKRKFWESEISYYRDVFKGGTPEEKSARNQATWREIKNANYPVLLVKFLAFYFKSMVLVFFLYLIRMVERKGILETILADKMRFFLAVIGWGYFLWKYPYEMVKEIVVEAELRRIGGLFRKLNPVERLSIRQIASSQQYSKRLETLRKYHRAEHQHGLALAILATVLCLVFLPKQAQAKDVKAEITLQGIVMADARAGPTPEMDTSTNQHPTPTNLFEAVMPGGSEVLILRSEPFAFREEVPPKQEVWRKIKHIPIISLVLCSYPTVDKERGDDDEIRFDCLSGNAFRRFRFVGQQSC